MQIKEKDGTLATIYAVYWYGDETYFYGLPKGYKGLLAYKATDVEIVDPHLSGNFTFWNNGIFYRHLLNENLLEELVEYDETAYKRFLEIIKEEGLVDPDFY